MDNKDSENKPQTSAQAKVEYLISMNHELRSPLNAILGFTQIMERDNGFPEKHKNNLKQITQSAEKLFNLINEIITVMKLDDVGFFAKKDNLHSSKNFVASTQQFDEAELKKIPNLLLSQLVQAVRIGDLEVIEEINLEISKANPVVGNYFTNLAKNFELDQLMSLLQDFNAKE